jgi:tetratricopeptide (TPR) repeat protein
MNAKKILVPFLLFFFVSPLVVGCLAAQEEKISPWDKAEALLLDGEFAEAVKLYTVAIETNPDHPELYLAYYNRAQAFVSLEKFDDAHADFTKSIELVPEFEEGYKMRGILNLRTGNCEEALGDFTRLIILDPKSSSAHGNRGTALSCMGRFEEAVSDYTEAIELDPECARCYYNRYQALLLLGREAEAQSDLEMAGSLDSRYKDLGGE